MTLGIGAILLVNGYQIALSPADIQGLNLTFSNASGENMDTRQNDTAANVVVDATAIANEATGHATRPFDEETLKTWTPCSIMFDGMTVFYGKCKVSSALRRFGRPVSYEFSFLGPANDWMNALGTKTVNSLPASIFSDILGYDPSRWIWDEGYYTLDPSNAAYLITWPPVNFGQWATFGKVDWSEFVPQIRKSAVLKAIFASIGWNLVSNWNDIDDFWHFWTGSQLRALKSTIVDYGLRVSDSSGNTGTFSVPVGLFAQFPFVFDTDTPLPDYNPTGAFAITGTDWTVPVTRKYVINAHITSDIYGNVVNFLLWNATTSTYVPMLTNSYAFGGVGGILSTDNIEFTAGDRIQVVVNGTYVGPIVPPLPYSFPPGSWFQVVPDPGLNYGDTLDPASIINEDVTCIDYIRGLTQTSNLYFSVDAPAKTIYIEPRDSWVDKDGTRQPGFYELTEPVLVEVNEAEDVRLNYTDELSPLMLTYKEDSLDWFLNLTLTRRPLYPFASAIFDMGGHTADQLRKNINQVFKAFCLIADNQVAVGGGCPVPVFPRLWKAEADGLDYAGDYPVRTTSWLPVCAYSVLNNGLFTVKDHSGADVTYTQYVYSTMMPIANTSGIQMKTLAFGNQVDDLGNTIVGRMQGFYFRELMSRRIGITANVRAIIGTPDVNRYRNKNWQFRFAWDSRQWSMIALHNFNPVSPTTELEMLADRQPVEADLLLITSPNDSFYKNP
jgi:hypothetical protein